MSLSGGLKSLYEYEVQWGDCDAADIVYYPNYYRWFDNASHHLFSSVGLGFSALREQFDSVGFPLVSAKADFLLPSRVADILNIESTVSSISRKTLQIEHIIRIENKDIVRGKETRILGMIGDSGQLQAAIIPNEIRTRLGFNG